MSLFLVGLGLYSSLALAQVSTNSESYGLPVPNEYDNFQNNDGTCYAYAAANYINALAGLTDRMRIRPRSSMAVLSLNESSNFLNAQIISKFVSKQKSVFDGGWPDQLLQQYARSLESLIPVSEKLEWELGSAVPFYEAPRSFTDVPRIREIISKKFYKYLSKSLRSRSLKQEAENYVLELEKMGLYMDHSIKKMIYQKPSQIVYSDLQMKLKEKNFGVMSSSFLPANPNSCISEARRIITTSLSNGHPLTISIMMEGGYHAMLIYKITSNSSVDKVYIKNSWSTKPFISMNLSNLCHPKAQTNLGFTWSLFDVKKQ
jgi:hypothetical protein